MWRGCEQPVPAERSHAPARGLELIGRRLARDRADDDIEQPVAVGLRESTARREVVDGMLEPRSPEHICRLVAADDRADEQHRAERAERGVVLARLAVGMA